MPSHEHVGLLAAQIAPTQHVDGLILGLHVVDRGDPEPLEIEILHRGDAGVFPVEVVVPESGDHGCPLLALVEDHRMDDVAAVDDQIHSRERDPHFVPQLAEIRGHVGIAQDADAGVAHGWPSLPSRSPRA